MDVLSNREYAKESFDCFHFSRFHFKIKYGYLELKVYQNNKNHEIERIKKKKLYSANYAKYLMIVCLIYTTTLIFQGKTNIGSFVLVYNGLKSVTQNIDIFVNTLKKYRWILFIY